MNRTLYYYLFGKLRSRLTSAENAIANKISADDLDTAIAGKADANDVSDLADRVTSAENAITGKADASDLSTLAGRVTDAETAIAGKAAASDFSDLADRVSTAETAISGKASSSDLSTLAGRVSDAEGTIAEHTTALSGKASASDLSTLAGRVSDAETAISGKASIASVTELARKVSDAAGPGHVLGGYIAKILAYEETSSNNVTTYTLFLSPETDEVDWTKFSAGDTIRISVPDATTEEFVSAEIATIDSANCKLTLTEALNVRSGTMIGMEKRTVSGYTGSATGGLTAYRVTYNGASNDDELCEGRDVYTRAGSGAFVRNTIQGKLGNYIFLTSAATSGTNAIYLGPSNAIITDAIPDEDETASASGENNMVTGEASSADGAYNVVSGIGTHVSGTNNKVFGDNSTVSGTENLVAGDSNYVVGIGNKVADSLNIVVGNSNTALRQGAVLIGDMNVALAVNTYAFGWGNQLKAHGVMGVGTRNTISGKWSVAVGYANKVSAETAYVVGRYADVPDAAENKNAFIIWGGEHQNNAEAFAVRSFRAEENPLFNSASLAPGSSLSDPNPKDSAGERKYISVPAYRTEYKGQLKPKTQTIAVSGTMTVTLDPTQYSRVMLTGSGTVMLDVADHIEEGDKIELVFNSYRITPVFPSAWTTLGVDFTEPRIYVVEIAQVGVLTYYKVLYPDSQGGGGGEPGASAYEVALANGFAGTEAEWLASLKGDPGDILLCLCTVAPQALFDGMIWIRGGSSTPQYYRAMRGVTVVAENDAQGTLADGTIILKEVAE